MIACGDPDQAVAETRGPWETPDKPEQAVGRIERGDATDGGSPLGGEFAQLALPRYPLRGSFTSDSRRFVNRS